MTTYFQLVGDPKRHPPASMQPAAYDAAMSSVQSNTPYNDVFSANDFSPDDLCFVDFIQTHSGVPMFSKKFCDKINNSELDGLLFYETIVMYGTENIMQWIGDDVGGFYCATYKNIVSVIDEKAKPVQFWPKLKKFKVEDFVLTSPLPSGVEIAVDLKKPFMSICTERFKECCERHKLSVGFMELPTAVD